MVRTTTPSTVSRRNLLRVAGAAVGTVTLGSLGTAVAGAQESDCADVDPVYAIVLEPEDVEDVDEHVDDPAEDERYCTVEEQLAGVLGVEEGDELRLWDRSLGAADAAGSQSLFTVASVTDDRLARIRANADDLEAVGIDPRGVGKVSTAVASACFDEAQANGTGI